MNFERTSTVGWTVYWYFDADGSDAEVIIDRLLAVDASLEVVKRAEKILSEGINDFGFTYTSMKNMSSVIVVGASSSGKEFLNSYVHELRHVVDDISAYYNLDNEESAYLTGDISNSVAEIICKFSCDECRKK